MADYDNFRTAYLATTDAEDAENDNNTPELMEQRVRRVFAEYTGNMEDAIRAADLKETEEGIVSAATRERNARLNADGLEAVFCRECDSYCEVLIGTDRVCGDCEESEDQEEESEDEEEESEDE